MLREALGVSVTSREGRIHLRGDRGAVMAARNVLERLGAAAQSNQPLTRQQVLDLIADESGRAGGGWSEARRGWGEPDEEEVGEADELTAEVDGELGLARPARRAWDGRLDVYSAGRPIRARSENQEAYIRAIRDNDLVFAIGPAGTGKTYLAVAAAVHLLKTGRVMRLVLVRPAVEAGEKLGFLPGDMQEKVNPYLRPLMDALHDMVDYATIQRFMQSDVVEVAPLAFMRGRTLNNAVVILDEAQNTTRLQMKMFLTRMGNGSKMIVTGDTTQIDLPDVRDSGLVDAARRLKRTPGVEFITLDRADVVRHPLVQRVIDAYGEDEAEGKRGS
ncbi:MAG: PhoH family protein [Phycisphaerales bacterium]|nr:PhoH family protein [Phycisphaerales bacterium]